MQSALHAASALHSKPVPTFREAQRLRNHGFFSVLLGPLQSGHMVRHKPQKALRVPAASQNAVGAFRANDRDHIRVPGEAQFHVQRLPRFLPSFSASIMVKSPGVPRHDMSSTPGQLPPILLTIRCSARPMMALTCHPRPKALVPELISSSLAIGPLTSNIGVSGLARTPSRGTLARIPLLAPKLTSRRAPRQASQPGGKRPRAATACPGRR